MSKVGRNDPCPCGSGKKYKKCCIDKSREETLHQAAQNHPTQRWSYEAADRLTTEEIVAQLRGMNIPFNQEEFMEQVSKFHSAEDLSERWFADYQIQAEGLDEDFPWFAAWILWNRLASEKYVPAEQMDEMMTCGFDLIQEGRSLEGCDLWLQVWEKIKMRIRPEDRSLKRLDEIYKATFYVSNFVQDLEEALQGVGMIDRAYFEKRIQYCNEFCTLFPDESENLLHNMRRAVIESLIRLQKYEEAFQALDDLVRDYPENMWSYVEYGDTHFLGDKSLEDLQKAEQWYTKASAYAQDEYERLAIEERMTDMNQNKK